MLKNLKQLLLTDTSKDTAVVFAGTIINAAIGGVFFILAPRILGPAQYGLFAVVTSTGILIAGLANFGIDTGILKFSSQKDILVTNRILKLALEAYISIGIILSALGFLSAGYLAQLLKYPDITSLLRIAFLSLILFLLTDFFTAALQSKRQFFKASIINIASNVGRLIILIIAAYFFTINLYFLTLLFFAVNLVSVIIGKIFVPFNFMSAKGHFSEFKKFFGFNIWIAASLVVSSIPVDNYLLIRIAGPLATGLYAAPVKILSITNQLAGNLSRVVAPRYSTFQNDKEAIKYSKKVVPIIFIIVSGLIITGALAEPIVKLLLGNQYLDSINIFKIISASYAFYFADTIAVSLIIYYFGKPKITFLITLAIFALWTIANIILIPKYQARGAAFATLISGITAFTLFTLYISIQFLKRKDDQT